jgi:hypothetical protein
MLDEQSGSANTSKRKRGRERKGTGDSPEESPSKRRNVNGVVTSSSVTDSAVQQAGHSVKDETAVSSVFQYSIVGSNNLVDSRLQLLGSQPASNPGNNIHSDQISHETKRAARLSKVSTGRHDDLPHDPCSGHSEAKVEPAVSSVFRYSFVRSNNLADSRLQLLGSQPASNRGNDIHSSQSSHETKQAAQRSVQVPDSEPADLISENGVSRPSGTQIPVGAIPSILDQFLSIFSKISIDSFFEYINTRRGQGAQQPQQHQQHQRKYSIMFLLSVVFRLFLLFVFLPVLFYPEFGHYQGPFITLKMNGKSSEHPVTPEIWWRYAKCMSHEVFNDLQDLKLPMSHDRKQACYQGALFDEIYTAAYTGMKALAESGIEQLQSFMRGFFRNQVDVAGKKVTEVLTSLGPDKPSLIEARRRDINTTIAFFIAKLPCPWFSCICFFRILCGL